MKHSRNTVPAEKAASVFPELAPVGEVVRLPARSDRDFALVKVASSSAHSHETGHAAYPDVTATSLSFLNMNDYGGLLVSYLRARKAVFIDRLDWKLPNTEGMEFDQYDTPQCRWIVIHEKGEVLGGVRLMPTTAKCGTYTYMLRDGQLGLLEDFQTDVLFFQAPVSDDIWEASRLFIADSVPAQQRSHIQYVLMRKMITTAAELNARHVIGIVPAVWSRWLRRLGLYAVPVGPKFKIGSMSSQAALFNISDQLEWAQNSSQDEAG